MIVNQSNKSKIQYLIIILYVHYIVCLNVYHTTPKVDRKFIIAQWILDKKNISVIDRSQFGQQKLAKACKSFSQQNQCSTY